MMINEFLRLAPALLAGLLLGVLFFGGLWWTLRKGLASQRPARWMLASLVLRMGLVLTGFYFVGGDHWQRLLAALLGFVIARLVVTRLTGAAGFDHRSCHKKTGGRGFSRSTSPLSGPGPAKASTSSSQHLGGGRNADQSRTAVEYQHGPVPEAGHASES